MKKVLVTGGSGFIGSHLVDTLLEKGCHVTVFDSLESQVHPYGLPEYHNLASVFVRGDVRNPDDLKNVISGGFDTIVHFAAAVGVGQSQYQVARYVEANIQGTANLLDVLVNTEHDVKKLLVASSMSIYGEGLYMCGSCGKVKPPLRDFSTGDPGGPGFKWEPDCPVCGGDLRPVPTDEDTPLVSNSIYAISKKEQEEMSLLIGRTYGLPVTALRFFNVYGPRQSLSNPYTGIAAIFMSRLKNGNPPVIYEDGLQSRDFVWVEDVVNACILAMESEKADYNVFNVGSGKPSTVKEVAGLLAEISGLGHIKPEVTCRLRKGDVRHCYADISKISRVLGYSPRVCLKEGLRRLSEWSREKKADDRFEEASRELEDRKLV